MKKSIILSFVFIACFNHIALASVFSTQEQIYSRMDEQRVQADPRFQQQNAVIKKPEIGVYQNIQTTKLTRDELVKQPTLLVQALLTAVMSNNGENATFLLPLYQQLSLKQQIPVLTTWVTALSDKYHRRYSQSIRQYRQLVADYPGNQIIRFQLATALFENNEMEAAEDQFHKLQSENLPVEVNDVISKYLSVISSRDNWALRGGVTYLNDPNVNNAPEMGTRIGSWVAKKRERAEGFGFWGELSKKWSWGNGFFNEFRLNGDGKYYWNNKKYSEYTVRGSLGSGYQSAVQKFTILPFMEQMWYAGGNVNSESVKRYSKSSGATVEWQYWVSPDLQWSSQYEYGEQRYIARKHLNGNYHYIATNLIYFTDSKQYWLLGMNFNRTSTRDSDNSYIRRGIQIGWGQEWGMGLSSRLTLSYARKNYYAPMPIFQVTQRNKEYGAQLSLWHRAFHFGGITPRVTFAYNKVKSNHAFFTYDKKRLFLEFTKTF
ncbi:porin family protein [Actinobacillus porcinus]|uniref:porin family protein n=1 Tax=Actinobacillus porcinus TaxID=51048 RepID=UPI00235569BE|nr:porin family protein [Actinobacillus porcinus]